MYNLMVTAGDNAWEEGAYVWSRSRIFEHTSDEIKEQFAELSSEALEALASFPTLFMYERGAEGTARVGRIKHVQQRGSDIRVIYEFDDAIPGLTHEQIVSLKWELEIEDFEFTRTHWAVKDADLLAALRVAGLAPASKPAPPPETEEAAVAPTVEVTPGRVFLVHGRDDGALNKVARFLETKVELEVFVLSERPNRGRTIITKFQEESAGATFAVVLMTPDDVGSLRPELSGGRASTSVPRARQNVIFELGFFLGKLGVSRVCVLLGSGVEKPSDYDGVVYIPFDDHEGWKAKLVTELHAANVPVSPNWWKDN